MSFTLTNPIVGHGDLKTTVDYAEAAEYARTLGREHVFVLIEEFAEQVALVCLVMFPQVCEVIVTVRKPKILPDAEEAGVRRSFER